jgi:hypothetical protein
LTRTSANWYYWRRVVTGAESHTNGKSIYCDHPLGAWYDYYQREVAGLMVYARNAFDEPGYKFDKIEAAVRRARIALDQINELEPKGR